MEGRSVASSETLMTHRALPGDTNAAGNIHGGVILKHIDLAGAVCAMRHARGCSVVTASIDRMEFKAPVHVGELMVLKASVNFVGSKSMEVGVRVESEDLLTGNIRHVASAYLTFVAMDAEKKATAIPPLIIESKTQERRLQEATLRRAARHAERKREKQAQAQMEQNAIYSPEEVY
ncbi:acyl-CoA thioesterase [Halodesulfovibrio sp.]|jgi:acyl-CoA hydrolase|uniref:acyl-CoA thioesterase n=1 Tax=Halodesulfovibrio sp. TaxID=1912772 RepID=UPI0025CC0510|nr:acyl-CoA thioesterase [Halodesulfovibrio sp.]MCT4536362.1 acyl-CoA thioesterase [Halodesulfovibrio sp.]MCT4625585.1 acyl-CoA thioesterase [Halodesulfovibrio sp.]